MYIHVRVSRTALFFLSNWCIWDVWLWDLATPKDSTRKHLNKRESCLLRNVHLHPPEHIHPGSFLGEEMVPREEQKNRRQFSFYKAILLLLACTRTLTRAGKSIYLNRRNNPLKRRPVSIIDTFVRHCNSDASASASPFTRFALLLLLVVLRGSWFWFLPWRSCRARAQSWGERDGRMETARQRACVQLPQTHSKPITWWPDGRTDKRSAYWWRSGYNRE